jgi:hypothetical protein
MLGFLEEAVHESGKTKRPPAMGGLKLIQAIGFARVLFSPGTKLAEENAYQPQGLSTSFRFVLLGRFALRVTL